jgi:hypothetical protein
MKSKLPVNRSVVFIFPQNWKSKAGKTSSENVQAQNQNVTIKLPNSDM